jgi:hypothetical protein
MVEIILAAFGLFFVGLELIFAIVTIKDFGNTLHNN